MILRALLALAALAGLLFAACGPPPLTEQQICGPAGCDACTGLTCGQADAGVH